MTDEMLDQLEALASGVVLRTADTEVAVVPMLVAEVRRLQKENRNLAETVAAYGSYQDRLALLAETTAMIRAAIRAAEREVGA